MADIPLIIDTREYVNADGVTVTPVRSYANVQFVSRSGRSVPWRCTLDLGAGISVIPFSVWHERDLQWHRLGLHWTSLPDGRAVEQKELAWQDVPAELGMMERVFLIDPKRHIRTGPHRLIGKFVQEVLKEERLERMVLVGQNFLRDNNIGLSLEPDGMTGRLIVPD